MEGFSGEGFSGEQFALPEAVTVLRKIPREDDRPVVAVSAADPLSFQGILTPKDRIASTSHATIRVG